MTDDSPSRSRRWRLAPGRSIKRRLVLVFLLLAVALTGVFILGAQRAFTLGWREAAQPLLMDYVDRLAADVTGPDGGPPSIDRAAALTKRLQVTVQIEGPQVNWQSHPGQTGAWRHTQQPRELDGASRQAWQGDKDWNRILQRRTADGHVIRFGLNDDAFERRQRNFGLALAALLTITLVAYLLVRRLLRPLDDIRAGARRFGAGDFSQPIPVQHPCRPDELGQLAITVNTMGRDIHQMLEAKRGLLLAISHELRSPITRARLNAELLPEDGEAAVQRQALLRDLQEMAGLISDLLESERLTGHHATLHREPVSLPALVRDVLVELTVRHPGAATVQVEADADLPEARLDRTRMRLLLRNLLDNALRHGAGASSPPTVRLAHGPDGITLEVRDHGPGVADDQLEQLAQAFYRPDSARTRHAGGVGLGLYLCRLVTQAHGGRFDISHAHPGLRVMVTLPLS
ncbi:MAG: HAMP domain-containing sensor histidine kinase [Burkholderiaceae bacterium]